MLKASKAYSHLKSNGGWYYRWVKKMGLSPKEVRELDTTRAKWIKARHLGVHYDVVEAVFLQRGIMVEIADITAFWNLGDTHDKYSWRAPKKIVASIDETRVQESGKGESSGKGMGEAGDNGETLTPNGSKSLSFMGGMYLDCTATPAMSVYNSGLTYSPDWGRNGLVGCRYSSNDKGSFDTKTFTQYIKVQLIPDMVTRGLGEVTTGQEGTESVQWGVIIFDGVATHLILELIKYCRGNFVELILRPPNCMSVCQLEDSIIFKVFKRVWYKWKDKILMLRITNPENNELNPCKLTWEDINMGIAEAHAAAFTFELMRKAWAAVGVMSFTRKVQHRLLMKEAAAAARRKESKVHVMSLNEAIDCVMAPDSQVLPEARDAGRGMHGRILAHERPLTSEEAIKERQDKWDAQQAVKDKAASEKLATATKLAARGMAAEQKLIENNGNVKHLNVLELKDFLRHKLVPASELAGKRAELEEVFSRHVFVPELAVDPGLGHVANHIETQAIQVDPEEATTEDDAYYPGEGQRIEVNTSPWLTTRIEKKTPWVEYTFLRRELEENEDGDTEWCCYLQPMDNNEATDEPEKECFLSELKWARLYPCESYERHTQGLKTCGICPLQRPAVDGPVFLCE